jgi:hypothetical protein
MTNFKQIINSKNQIQNPVLFWDLEFVYLIFV